MRTGHRDFKAVDTHPESHLMPFFERATHATIVNGVFVDNSSKPAEDVMAKLTKLVILSATHRSDDCYDQPKCHEETRTAIIERIQRWAEGNEEPILWLTGPAGAGKSAIARTLADRWQGCNILGASFFFFRNARRRNNKQFFLPTVAYQLAETNPVIRMHMESAMLKNPLILKKSLLDQFRILIISPIKAAIAEGESINMVIIVDGLDECSARYRTTHFEAQQRQILEAIASAAREQLPIRFLIASRPESQIRNSFKSNALFPITTRVLLSGGPDANRDIETFLECKFSEIRCDNPTLGTAWPPKGTIKRLVEMSSGCFIYPSTIVRHISSPRVNPEESLQEILGLAPSSNSGSRPFARLDALYIHILESVAPSSQRNVCEILQLLVRMSYLTIKPITYDPKTQFQSLEHLANMLCTTPTQISTDLVDLHSILAIPENPKAGPVRFIHASLGDFLADPTRSGRFHTSRPTPLHVQLKLMKFTRRFLYTYDAWSAAWTLLFAFDCEVAYFIEIMLDSGRRSSLHFFRFPIVLIQALLLSDLNEIWQSPIKWWWSLAARNGYLLFLSTQLWVSICLWPFFNPLTSVGHALYTCMLMVLLLLAQVRSLAAMTAFFITILYPISFFTSIPILTTALGAIYDMLPSLRFLKLLLLFILPPFIYWLWIEFRPPWQRRIPISKLSYLEDIQEF